MVDDGRTATRLLEDVLQTVVKARRHERDIAAADEERTT